MTIKKLFSCLAATVSCWMGLTSSQAETTPSGFQYTKENESIVIQKYTGTESDVIIPDEIEGLPVTKLSGLVFYDVSTTSVFIPASVSEIDVDVFIECESLESIEVYHNNKFFSSQDGVLFDKLKTTLLRYPPAKEGVEYKVPPTVTQLAEKAFEANQNLESVSLGSVREVPNRAFAVCQKLKHVGSDGNFVSIGDLAFVSCGQLENIPVHPSTTSTKTIGGFAFRNCHSLRNMTIPNSVTNIGWGCFQNCTGLTNVSLGNGISVLNSQTFAGCTNLANIKLPNKLISIGTSEFENCEQLKELTFPSTFREMIQDCFAGTHLDKITFKGNTPVITGYITTYDPVLSPEPLPPEFEIFSDHYPEIYYFDKTTGWNIEDYVLDSFEPYFQKEGDHLNGIVEVPLAAHCGMKGIPLIGLPSDFEYRIEGDEVIITKYLGTDLDVVFPNEIEGKPVTGIDYRFYDAADLSGNHNKNNITSCQLPENLRYIRNRLFDHCTNLATIQIPANVETIGELAFSGCYKLTELHIPNGVKTIGSDIIAICNNIKTINIPASVEDIYGGIYSESFGMNAFAWSYGLEEITVDEENPFYRAIDGVLFNKEGTTLLQYPCGRPGTEYVIPEGVTKLAWGSFLKAGYLETVRFPSSLKVINEASFHQCTSLTSIDIPDTVQAIRAGAFQGCSNLKQVTIGIGVELLEGHAFSKCQALENVYFKGNCPEIDYLGLPDLALPGYSLPGVIFTRNEPCPNVYYVKGTEGWDDPAKLDWLDPEKLFTWTPEAPYLFVSKKDPAGMKLVFSGELQASDDLENWTTVPAESPYQDAPAQGKQKFFRVKK